jgi:hypothetical protein
MPVQDASARLQHDAGASTIRSPRRGPVFPTPRPAGHQQRPRRSPQHPFSDGTLSKALPPAPPVGSKNDEIGLSRIGMQHDRASRIAVLLDGAHRDAFALGAFPQARQKPETFALMP